MVVVSSNFTAPVDGILLEAPSTKLLLNNQEIGTATLYVTESNVVWGGGVRASGAGPSPTISLLYPSISLHAVQRDPLPALYMLINYELRLPEVPPQPASVDAQEDDDDDFDADDQPITELRFIPANEGDLQAMYSAMNQGQSLHPDPTDEVDDDDDHPYMDGEEFDDGEEEFEDAEENNPAAEAAARLRQLRLQRANGTQPYEDADDTEAGNGDGLAEE